MNPKLFLTRRYYEDSKWTAEEWEQIRRLDSYLHSGRIMLIKLEEIDMKRLELDSNRDIALDATAMNPSDIVVEILERTRRGLEAKANRAAMVRFHSRTPSPNRWTPTRRWDSD
jgi:hypothetical protein